MINIIGESAINFCHHQMGLDCQELDHYGKKEALIAYIDVTHDHTQKVDRVYIVCEKSFVQKITEAMLFEEESDEETLIDMILETTNLIVGSAKVLAQESKDIHFTISTPHYEKEDIFDYEYDQIKIINSNGADMIIALKEQN
jgi:chemotaxis protein CheY-P-specific phosphatase CheC